MKASYVMTLNKDSLIGVFSSIELAIHYLEKYESIKVNSEKCNEAIANFEEFSIIDNNDSHDGINPDVYWIMMVFHYEEKVDL